MTREEAINNLNMIRFAFVEAETKEQRKIIDDTFDMAIEALKQENVLNEILENIKTEIDFIPTYGAKFVDGSINVHVNKKDVLQIIDKYRGDA